MDKPTTFKKIMSKTPIGVGPYVLSILSIGRQHAISRSDLVSRLMKYGPALHERQVRQVIHDLRREGYLICSAPGEDGGYYLAADRQEFDEFIDRELHPKAMDILETVKAMKASARRVWGDAVQLSLMR